MKFVIFIASWLCLAFIQPVTAQTKPDTKLKDTLIIHLKGDNQVHIIGKSLEEISKYQAANSIQTLNASDKGKKKEEKQFNSPDSLKNLFLADYQKAVANESITNASKNIHYLVSKEGKRRMKAATDSYTEEPFNLETEVKRLEMHLPAYHYTIYDLLSAMEIHFYLEDSASLALLNQVNLDEAMKFLGEKKKEQKKYYRIGLEENNNLFSIKEVNRSSSFDLEYTGLLGISLFGSTPSPIIDFELSFIKKNKYSHPTLRSGIKASSFLLVDYSDRNFNYIDQGYIVDVFVSWNMYKTGSKISWYGINIGNIFGDKDINQLNNSLKFGLHAGGPGGFVYSYEYIFLEDGFGLSYFSAKFPIFSISANQ